MKIKLLMNCILMAFFPIQLFIVIFMKKLKVEYVFLYIFSFAIQLLLAFIKKMVNKLIEVYVELKIDIRVAFIISFIIEVALTIVILFNLLNGFIVFFFNGVVASAFLSKMLFERLEKDKSE